MTATTITIRPAYADDDFAVARLAALDSAQSPPPAPLLIAEIDGQIRAALSRHDGSVIADPFFPTADTLALLRAHAASSTAAPTNRRRRAYRLRHAFG